ncbi:MAG: helix-turn-helix transcriptional regulator [Candidatus Aenigmarchaeota archaeon]|nr:helix-turn-helix transcriptional regulator [Candidatus Aenigmarchaeota archaeon]
MKGNGYCPKPLEQAAIFLSKKWTLSIIVTIGNFGTLRFNDLLKRIEGVTQKTLSERLKELGQYNLLARQAFPEKPPRVEYSLTRNGQKVRRAVLPLLQLAESQTFARGLMVGPTAVLLKQNLVHDKKWKHGK